MRKKVIKSTLLKGLRYEVIKRNSLEYSVIKTLKTFSIEVLYKTKNLNDAIQFLAGLTG